VEGCESEGEMRLMRKKKKEKKRKEKRTPPKNPSEQNK
jgi:hypothetical protein